MSLASIIRSGVKTANKITKDLQCAVSYQRYVSQDGFGTPTYAAVVSLQALVDWKQRHVTNEQGELVTTSATVTFLDVAALLAATGAGGLSDNDLIVLPDGTTGPIVGFGGFLDAGTGKPFATEVML